MDAFTHLVERRIAEAERAGVFANLPGSGRPLELEDLSGIPEELRAGYIVLKSSGFVPPELEARKEWLRLADLLAACADPERQAALRRGAAKAWLRYRLLAEQAGCNQAWLDYQGQIVTRLERPGA